MKKIIGIVVVVLLIPLFIFTIKDIDRTPVYSQNEFIPTNISTINYDLFEKLDKYSNNIVDNVKTYESIDNKTYLNIGKFNDNVEWHQRSIFNKLQYTYYLDYTNYKLDGYDYNSINTTKINYIEGDYTQVVDNQLVVSKPKQIISKNNNLFDNSNYILHNHYFSGNSPYVVLTSFDSSAIYLPIKSNTNYTVKTTVEGLIRFRLGYITEPTIQQDNLIYGVDISTNMVKTILTGNNATYLILQISQSKLSEVINTLQINEGTTALPYQPFVEHKIDLVDDVELPKLPNGVGDRYLANGNVEKKVGKYNMWQHPTISLDATLTNTYRFIFSGFVSANNYISNENNISIMNNFNWLYSFTSDTRHFYSDGTNLFIFIEKPIIDGITGTILIDKLKNYLQTNNVYGYFQLATPITETKASYDSYIATYTNGTITVDNGLLSKELLRGKMLYSEVEPSNNLSYYYELDTPILLNDNLSLIEENINKLLNYYDKTYLSYNLNPKPSNLSYGTLQVGTYQNLNTLYDNGERQVKLYKDNELDTTKYNIELIDNKIRLSTSYLTDTHELITIYENNEYTTTNELNNTTLYKVEGYIPTSYIDGKFNNTVLAFFWIIPIFLVGGLLYLLIGKGKE